MRVACVECGCGYFAECYDRCPYCGERGFRCLEEEVEFLEWYAICLFCEEEIRRGPYESMRAREGDLLNFTCSTCGRRMVMMPFYKKREEKKQMSTGYSELANVLTAALMQASNGKGKERHADNQEFEKQPIMWIEEHFKSFQLGQAVKKIHESQRLPTEMAVAELLGAINFLAARVIFLQQQETTH